jgi:hypothetical protein
MPPGPIKAASFRTDAARCHLLVDAVTEYGLYMLDQNGLVISWNAGVFCLKSYEPKEIIAGVKHNHAASEDKV